MKIMNVKFPRNPSSSNVSCCTSFDPLKNPLFLYYSKHPPKFPYIFYCIQRLFYVLVQNQSSLTSILEQLTNNKKKMKINNVENMSRRVIPTLIKFLPLWSKFTNNANYHYKHSHLHTHTHTYTKEEAEKREIFLC